MKMKRYVSIVLLLLSFSLSLFAQEEEEIPKIEVFGGYSLLRAEGENLNGWKIGVGFTVNRWLAIAADADGHYFSERLPAGKLNKSEYSVTFGPHFSLRNKSKIVPFAYTMVGAAWEKTSLAGESESATGFAFEPGGGLDWEVSQRVSIRLVDISASITRISGTTSVKPKFSAGLVFKFGRK